MIAKPICSRRKNFCGKMAMRTVPLSAVLRALLCCESFRPPFSKGGAVEGAEPSSLVATSESSNRHFFFAKLFSLCLYRQRKKRQKPLCQQPIEALFGKNNLDAFFDTRGAKKALQRNAVFVGRRPTPRKPLKRLDPNFAALVLAKPFDKSKFTTNSI